MQNTLVQSFTREVSTWAGIIAAEHRFGGTEFKYGRIEIGHIHNHTGMLDIPFTVRIREVLVEEGLAESHHLLKDSGWISYYIRDVVDTQHALWLMRLSYLQKTSRRHPINTDELEKMQISDQLKHTVFPKIYALD